MKADKIEQLLRALHVEKITTTMTAKGQVVRSSCPLAYWDHKLGRDRKPSFALFANETGESLGKCLACGWKGSAKDLLFQIRKRMTDVADKKRILSMIRALDDHSSVIPAMEKLKDRAGFYSDRPMSESLSSLFTQGRDYSDVLSIADAIPGLPDGHEKFVVEMHEMLFSEEVLDQTGIDALTYLRQKRGLSDDAIRKWKIGWHPTTHRISVPQYDRNKRLVNIAGRFVETIVDLWEPPKWMHATGFKKEVYLFGEDRLEYSSSGKGTAFLVEGMFDVIWLDDQGIPNVLGMLGANLGRYQREKIVRWFDRLVIIPDGDQPGMNAATQIADSLGKMINVVVFPTPTGSDPDQLKPEHLEDIRSRFVS